MNGYNFLSDSLRFPAFTTDNPYLTNCNIYRLPASFYLHSNRNVINFKRNSKITFSENAFSKLAKKILKTHNETDCTICFEKLTFGTEVVKIPCNHNFHIKCIKQWFCNESTSCPICRRVI